MRFGKSQLILIFLILLLALGLCGCSKDKDTGQSEEAYKLEAIIKTDKDNYEVRVGDNNKLYEYLNNNQVKEIKGIQYNEKDLLRLPDSSNKSDSVINEQNEVAHNTYLSNLNQSVYYINYLLNAGYKIDLEAQTYKFIEYIMSNELNTKHLIITEDYLVVYDEEFGYMPEINVTDYIFD